MVEYLDPAGLAEAHRQLTALLAQPGLPEGQRARGVYFQQYLSSCHSEYGEEIDGPLGLPAQPLLCHYRVRNDGGRVYPTRMSSAPSWIKGDHRSVCIQCTPRELRPFLCGRFGRDFDMVNAQPVILMQLPARLKWTDDRKPADMPQLRAWCHDRPEFIGHVAEVHKLPMDAEMCADFRKDLVKKLMVRLMFGGAYDTWIGDLCKRLERRRELEPSSPRVVQLAAELEQLRKDVFQSHEFNGFVAQDRARLRACSAKETDEEIDRSVFARIAQKTENEVLAVMRAFCAERGWRVLTLSLIHI